MTDKRLDQMARRHGQHKSIRKTADEFGVSKSTAHRHLKKLTAPKQDMIRQGYTRLEEKD
jgi:DNA-binding IclR family transcriptional regulator